ncbi:ERF family protein [Clostridium rectalis]|uniref:ERF family protein n=1 Tax=Clostridium rectalis TaxID=2040295 RepID=UPI000F63F93F|nr:ERF family protein [Clostridium rectalis]
MANIFEKLQTTRVKLQNSNLKKSGKNAYAGFDYFELSDIMPKLNEILQEEKLTFIIDFKTDLATIKLINCEEPNEFLEASTQYAEANLKGCQPIQCLGGQQTYLRRYLIVNMFNITEPDLFDSALGKNKKTTNSTGNNAYRCAKCGVHVNENVAKFSYSKFKKILCIEHQKEGV